MEAHVINNDFQNAVIVAVATNNISPKFYRLQATNNSKAPIDYSAIHSSTIYDILNVHKSNKTIGINDAAAQGDYVSNKKIISFDPGETTRTLVINLLDDKIPEDEETFKVCGRL